MRWSWSRSRRGTGGVTAFIDEHAEIVGPLSEGRGELAVLFEPAAALQHALRLGLIFPEVGRGGARLEAVQFVGRVSGFKDSSTDRQPVC